MGCCDGIIMAWWWCYGLIGIMYDPIITKAAGNTGV